MAKIAISIVAFRSDAATLERAIRSALANPDGTPDGAGDQYRLVIVDNSPDDRLRALASIDPRITYDYVGANLGYGSGHNRGIRRFETWSDHHLIMNVDVQFASNVLPTLARYLERNLKTGLCMPKIVYPDGKLQPACKLLPTPSQLFTRRVPVLKRKLDAVNWLYEMRGADFSREMNVPFLSGCFMYTRTSILKTVGIFDERYFMYHEDTDLSRRIHEVAQTMYVPSVTVQHEGQYGSRRNPKLLWIHMQSAVRYFNKWGWFFDRDRKQMNDRAIAVYQLSARRPLNT